MITLGSLSQSFEMLSLIGVIGLFFIIEKVISVFIESDKKTNYAFYTVISGFIFARILFVIMHASYYKNSLFSMVNIYDRDLNLMGAIIGAVAFTFLYYKKKPLSKACLYRLALIIVLSAVFVGINHLEQATRGTIFFKVENSSQSEKIDILKTKSLKVINFWATWCPPCIKEMPVLIHASKIHKDIDFIFVNQFQTAEDVAIFEEKYDLKIPNLIFNDGSNPLLSTQGKALPTTLFLDDENKIIYSHIGAITAPGLDIKLNSLKNHNY